MGVYIKGMEMPKEGTFNIVHIYDDGHVSMPFWGKGMQIVSGITAVPVPPHGDLIDRDELMKHKGNCYDADGHLLYAVGTGSIMCAPTIIPAEEGE